MPKPVADELAVESRFPLGRADLARLVGSMDNIANLAVGAVDRISMRRFSLPDKMNEQLIKLATIDVEAAQVLYLLDACFSGLAGSAAKAVTDYQRLRIERREHGVMLLTLSNPGKLNATDALLHNELARVFPSSPTPRAPTAPIDCVCRTSVWMACWPNPAMRTNCMNACCVGVQRQPT